MGQHCLQYITSTMATTTSHIKIDIFCLDNWNNYSPLYTCNSLHHNDVTNQLVVQSCVVHGIFSEVFGECPLRSWHVSDEEGREERREVVDEHPHQILGLQAPVCMCVCACVCACAVCTYVSILCILDIVPFPVQPGNEAKTLSVHCGDIL